MEDEVTICDGEEAVRRWAHAKKLSSRTTDAIINMGYTSMEALSLLTEEDVTDCLDIPVGQRRLLVHSIVGTFPLGPAAASSGRDRNTNGTNQNSASIGPCAPQNANCSQPDQANGPSPEVQENEFIRNVLGQLHGPIPTSDSGMVSWQDPQIYLKSLTTSNNKASHFDIVD